MKYILILWALVIVTMLNSCKKYLDAKPSSTLTTIDNLDDLQSLLDYNYKVNQNQAVYSADNSCDDYYLNQADYDNINVNQRAMYTWQNSDIYPLTITGGDNDWSLAYARVYRANTILGKIDSVAGQGDISKKNDIEGQGYFLRGYNFLQLAWTFCKAYDHTAASSDLGLPLRQTTDFNQKIKQSSLQQTYEQIILDLKKAASLLPVQVGSANPTRPGKAAAYGMLARTYLSMRDYANCLLYSDSCLKIKSVLLDYSTQDSTLSTTFAPFAVPEIIYDSTDFPDIAGVFGKIDSNLLASYRPGDLRKGLFYLSNGDGTFVFKGTYNTSGGWFCGLATDEIYLMRAECYARSGNVPKAMADLNLLLNNRIDPSVFKVTVAADSNTALRLILQERRKELVFRGLRWMDIKRLNLEGAGISLRRFIDNKTYTLTANSPRFAMPLPEDAITLSGLQQNPY